MPTQANKALIYQIFDEGFNQGALSIVDEIFHPAFVDRSTPEQVPGPGGVKDYITMVRKGFPDISVSIEDLVAENEKVVVRTTWRGTHLGEYGGLAPTGKQVTRTMIQIFHVLDGRLHEEWNEGESLTALL